MTSFTSLTSGRAPLKGEGDWKPGAGDSFAPVGAFDGPLEVLNSTYSPPASSWNDLIPAEAD